MKSAESTEKSPKTKHFVYEVILKGIFFPVYFIDSKVDYYVLRAVFQGSD